MSFSATPEFFINMRSIPDKDSAEYTPFFLNELDKITYGVTIDGVYIHGWLYWHLNHWNILVDRADPRNLSDIRQVNGKPELRDNEWLIAEYLKKAEEQKKGLMIFGSRRLGKSEFEASWTGRGATIYEGSQNVIASTNEKDLAIITGKIDRGLVNLHTFFKHGRIADNWVKEVVLGFKDKDEQRRVWSTIPVRNLNNGVVTEAFAGLTPKTFIIDEVGKARFGEAYESAKPSFTTALGWRCVPILAGCVCAGTKVWNNKGELINIEDLNKEDGILGFDVDNQELSKESITYWQAPIEKQCYKITTKLGRVLECSEDHPLLYRARNQRKRIGLGKSIRRIYFKETKDLQPNDQIAIIESVPIFGTEDMWQPRMVGMLIGDGSYGFDKTPVFSNCDKELNDYTESRFNTVTEKSYVTKDNRVYKETRIKEICPELRKLGIYGQTKGKKTLPLNIDKYKKHDITEMIAGLYDTDGCIHYGNTNKTITITAAHKSILEEIKFLLVKFGIHGSIKFHKPNFKNPKDKNGYYVLLISDRRSILAFAKEIPLMISYKKKKLEQQVNFFKDKKDQIPKEVQNLRFESIKSIEYIGLKPVYNLTADTTHTYIANGIITHNTGGTLEQGSDAENYFTDPESHNFLAFEFLNKKRKYGMFISGLYRMEGKIETTFGKYLQKENGIIISEKSEIYSMPFFEKDDDKAKVEIQKELDKALKNKDPKAYLKSRMYFPEDPDDCFLTEDGNDFPLEALREHLLYLETIDNNGYFAELSRNNAGKVIANTARKSKRFINEWPAEKGTIKDAPFLILEEPEENTPRGLYVAGIDPYNQSQAANSTSLGTLCIYKRMYDPAGGTFQDCIVATLASRPETMKQWHEDIEMALDYYNAVAMPENEGGTLVQYFDSKNKAHMLADGYQLSKQINQKTTTAGRAKGLAATKANQNFYMNLMLEYTKDMVQMGTDINTGEPIMGMGLRRIKDPILIKEMLGYRKGETNSDRIIAFGHTLACKVYFDKIMPIVKFEEEEEVKPQKIHIRSPFSSSGRRMF